MIVDHIVWLCVLYPSGCIPHLAPAPAGLLGRIETTSNARVFAGEDGTAAVCALAVSKPSNAAIQKTNTGILRFAQNDDLEEEVSEEEEAAAAGEEEERAARHTLAIMLCAMRRILRPDSQPER